MLEAKETGQRAVLTITDPKFKYEISKIPGAEKIRDAVKKPLKGLKVAEHNGCHVLRPKEYMGFDDPEDPKVLKALIEATGAECLDYIDEAQCCGAPTAGINDKIPLQLSREKLTHIRDVCAQALITICPFCHMMFETNQMRIERMYNEKFGIPTLHYPQLLGLALGLSPQELALDELRVKPTEQLRRIGI
ncbi:MAG: CoB--CoM heterodisulfide reductase iron-sulfur subunit B family protein [Candidatus Bathyarchaeota archaeon]|nr:CoB--CoM heterodisulfide reductase iron-sulfur subunit B family protein [Candidatus Bathyarchaeota archaeon]